jgi:hypothetical protein
MKGQLISHFEKNHPDAARLPARLTDDGKLVWFCEPRDVGAVPSAAPVPARLFYPEN